jgi:hypothetical protein
MSRIGVMPFVWLSVPGRADRAAVERNSIALLSCLTGCPDRPSPGWLGRDAEPAEIRGSGLWNVDHVREHYDRAFLELLSRFVDATMTWAAAAPRPPGQTAMMPEPRWDDRGDGRAG